MSALAWIGSLLEPAGKLVDSLHTSAEERGQLRAALFGAQAELAVRVLEYESRIVEAQARVITAEAQGKSWLQRSWRPVVATSFGALVVYKMAGEPFLAWLLAAMAPNVPPLPILEIPGWVGAALTVCLGGYVAGRSGEKIAATLTSRQLDFSRGAGKVDKEGGSG